MYFSKSQSECVKSIIHLCGVYTKYNFISALKFILIVIKLTR